MTSAELAKLSPFKRNMARFNKIKNFLEEHGFTYSGGSVCRVNNESSKYNRFQSVQVAGTVDEEDFELEDELSVEQFPFILNCFAEPHKDLGTVIERMKRLKEKHDNDNIACAMKWSEVSGELNYIIADINYKLNKFEIESR